MSENYAFSDVSDKITMTSSANLLQTLHNLAPRARLALLADLPAEDAAALEYDWAGLWARPNQLAPAGDWRTWLVLAGRGFGKTRSGAEWVRGLVESGRAGRIALVAATAADARDVVVEGESGLLAISPPWNRPTYEPSKRRITWPNGARASLYSADEPDRLRGPQHDAAWADELAAWKAPEAWDMLMMGLRLGRDPRATITTTPRPTPIIRRLLADPHTAVTRGSTYENKDNLAPAFLSQIVGQYEGTRMGRQELYAELLEAVEGALWRLEWIDAARVSADQVPPLERIVVAVDPAATHGEDADETGIAVAGLAGNGHVYILHAEGCRLSPAAWASRVIALYDQYGADRIIAERNNGGEMVEHTLRTAWPGAPVKTVHASRGKTVRAEPVAALYEQGRVQHVGIFADLEQQMAVFPVDKTAHDDQVDALVYAVYELAKPARAFEITPLGRRNPLHNNPLSTHLASRQPPTAQQVFWAQRTGSRTDIN